MRQLFGVLAVAAFAMGCDDDSDSATIEDARVGLEMRAKTTQSQIDALGRTQETGLVFKEVLLGVTEIEFETAEENGREDDDGERDDDDIEFEGRYTVDLINGTSTPDFGIADIKPGVYEEIEFEVAGLMDDGASVIIVFDRPGTSGDAAQVEYSSRESFEIEIEDDQGFRLNDTDNNVLILFELDKLFDAVDLSQATIDDDGVIRINESSNPTIATQIRNNFDDAFDAGDDDDDDDRFDDDDDDDD